MNQEQIERLRNVARVMDMVVEDQFHDADNFDGKPFNGRTVAEYFGNQGAAIAAIAKALKVLAEEMLPRDEDTSG